MSNQNIEDTSPLNLKPNVEETAPVNTGSQPERNLKPRRWPWILLAIFILLLGTGAGVLAGYNKAIGERLQKQQSEMAMKATTQFQLGLVDQQSGNYENARKRFEYVIQLNPSFPGAAQKLAEVMIAQSTTATATVQPSPTVIPATPTPDTRGEEEIFTAAKAALAGQDWQKAIDTLDSLRKTNKTYKAIEVDGMYYVALRNRGMDKIRRGGLEEGIYDMSLTERFGPIDKEANTYRDWARLYLTGASFWQLDWVQVINYFSQVYPAVPMLTDGSGMTAADRYRKALISYGDQLAGQEKYCEAEQQYEIAAQVSPDNSLSQKSTQTYEKCHPATATKGVPTEAIPTAETPVIIEPTTEVPPVTITETPKPPAVEPTATPEPPTPTP